MCVCSSIMFILDSITHSVGRRWFTYFFIYSFVCECVCALFLQMFVLSFIDAFIHSPNHLLKRERTYNWVFKQRFQIVCKSVCESISEPVCERISNESTPVFCDRALVTGYLFSHLSVPKNVNFKFLIMQPWHCLCWNSMLPRKNSKKTVYLLAWLFILSQESLSSISPTPMIWRDLFLQITTITHVFLFARLTSSIHQQYARSPNHWNKIYQSMLSFRRSQN